MTPPCSGSLRPWLGLLACCALLGGCRCGQKRRSGAPPPRRDAGVALPLPVTAALRRHHADALEALVQGRKPQAEAAMTRLKGALRILEAQARLACLGPGRGRRDLGPENAPACTLRAEVVAVNDRLAHRLVPGDPLAEQLELLEWLARRLDRRLGAPLAAGVLPPVRADAPVPQLLPAAETAPRAGPLGRCLAGPRRILLGPERGAVAFHFGARVAPPTLLWAQRCDAAAPPCARDRLWLQALGPDGTPAGPPVDSQVDVTTVDAGAPMGLAVGARGSAALVLLRDGDPWLAPLAAPGGRPTAPWPLLVRGDPVGRRQGTLLPGPAWLSHGEGRRLLELRTFTAGGRRPVARVRLRGPSPDSREDLFGTPALLGLPEGYLVAFTTLAFLQIERFGRNATRQPPVYQVALPRAGLVDPQCVLVAAEGKGRYVLALGHRGRRTLGVLVGLDPQGRPLRLPVPVQLPFTVPAGCPLDLVVSRGRLLVVGQATLAGTPGPPELVALELGPDGRGAGPPLRLGPVARFGGARATAEGALVVWAASPPPGTPEAPARALGDVLVRSLRCR